MVYKRVCWLGALLAWASLWHAVPALGESDVNLEWRPASQTVFVGDTVDIGLYAVSDDPEVDQSMAAMDVIIAWDPVYMQLLGVDDTGGPGWLSSSFPSDPYGLNEVIPPQDGDGIYTALASLGEPVDATPQGTLVTTFRFDTLSETSVTVLEILESAGSPLGQTVVYSGDTPNWPVTGTLGSAGVTIVPEPGTLAVLALGSLCLLNRRR
jgi:hypothetical protein